MALTQRQMACFENNSQFRNEVAAALLPIAAGMMADSLVTLSDPAGTEVQQTFAGIRQRVADQILREQGINAQGGGMAANAGDSTAMKYLVRSMLMSPDWTLTPDQWAANETTARQTIQTALGLYLATLTAIPGAPPAAVQAERKGKAK